MENEKPRYFPGNSRKPLICCLCEDYYSNPCLLSCYHSFCSRCIENRSNNGVIYCPLCGWVIKKYLILVRCISKILSNVFFFIRPIFVRTQTDCEGNAPPTDLLLKKLVELFDMDNPPCANCDKRERSSMFFCSTCSKFVIVNFNLNLNDRYLYWWNHIVPYLHRLDQALCGICRENTHRAKMFSSHEILPTSKFSQEGLKKVRLITHYGRSIVQRFRGHLK